MLEAAACGGLLSCGKWLLPLTPQWRWYGEHTGLQDHITQPWTRSIVRSI